MNTFLSHLQVLSHKVENDIIHQRINDGYINATAMCKASGKDYGQYSRLDITKAFIHELSTELHICSSVLVQVRKGGNDLSLQGTWVHPQVAVNLGQWLSPKFAVLVSKWFMDWVSGNFKQRPEIPYHIRRYIANRSEVPYTHFSVLNELVFGLIAPMEQEGYTMPENMLPDISQGKMFSMWLRKEKGIEPQTFPQYTHRFEDGRVVKARLYPNELLGDFRRHFYDVWLPQRAVSYFSERHAEALTYLPKIIVLTAESNQKFLDVNTPSESITRKRRKKAILKVAPPVEEPLQN